MGGGGVFHIYILKFILVNFLYSLIFGSHNSLFFIFKHPKIFSVLFSLRCIFHFLSSIQCTVYPVKILRYSCYFWPYSCTAFLIRFIRNNSYAAFFIRLFREFKRLWVIFSLQFISFGEFPLQNTLLDTATCLVYAFWHISQNTSVSVGNGELCFYMYCHHEFDKRIRRSKPYKLLFWEN